MTLKNKYYAVANGRKTGIFLNWNECHDAITGYKNASYKKFDNKEEAEKFVISFVDSDDKNIDFIPDYYVYTDGSCSNNGCENPSAGIGIFFEMNDPRNVSEKLEGKQTNNSAELNAIIRLYSIIENDIINGKKITIVSDSKYALNCVSSYGKKCHDKNWVDDIPNKELVKTLYELYKNKSNVRFMHTKAHTNTSDIHSIGNSNADKLASSANKLENDTSLTLPESERKKSISIEDNITSIKEDIKDLKNTLKEFIESLRRDN